MSRYLWWLTERSIWAIAAYRVGNTLRDLLPPAVARPVLAVYELTIVPFAQILTNIELPLNARIGPGLRIYHGSGLVMSGSVVIGDRCTLRQGNNIGHVLASEHSPRLGNDIDIGAYSQILGAVTIGDRAKVGPHTVVLRDVPADATVFGVPGRVITAKEK